MAKTTSKDKKVASKVADKKSKVTKPSKKEDGKKLSKKAQAALEAEKKKAEEESSSSDSDSSDSESSSSSSDSNSESDSDEELKDADKESDSSDSSDDEEDKASDSSDSDSDSSDDEEEEKKEEKKESSVSADSSDSSDSDSSDEEEKDSKKRSADEEAAPVKKQKVEDAGEPATVFVGRLSWSIDDEWLKREFEPLGGVIGARVIFDRASGKSRGYGYVDFDSKAGAEKALREYQGREIDGRPVNLDISTGKQHSTSNPGAERAKKFGDTPSTPSDTLFLGNLSFNANRDGLFETFSAYGSVISVRIPTHPDTEQPKGFGYVQFSSVDEAKAALEALNGEHLEGRPVRLDYSAPRDPSNNRKSFGGNQGGRDRRSFGGNQGGRDRKSFTPTGSNRAPVTAEFKGNKKTFD